MNMPLVHRIDVLAALEDLADQLAESADRSSARRRRCRRSARRTRPPTPGIPRRVSFSLIEVEYSRMRPQPVQVRLQACSGSSISTSGNRFVRVSFLRSDVADHGQRQARGGNALIAPQTVSPRAKAALFRISPSVAAKRSETALRRRGHQREVERSTCGTSGRRPSGSRCR